MWSSGPWSTKPENEYIPAQVWADSRELARVYGETKIARQANAQLMAAAPDLYEAIEALLGTFKARCISERNAVLKAEAALTKARGEA